MTFVAINVLTVPEGAGDTLEQRFAGRAGMVEQSPGFVSFELLRPAAGTDDYLVVTHWQDEASYQSWLASREFSAGHGGRPAASGSQIWTFEVVQHVGG
ncbi:MAG: antibiotic biosynthesis monooxygenase family protein [Candidatus Nanopelagicales bacterium]